MLGCAGWLGLLRERERERERATIKTAETSLQKPAGWLEKGRVTEALNISLNTQGYGAKKSVGF